MPTGEATRRPAAAILVTALLLVTSVAAAAAPPPAAPARKPEHVPLMAPGPMLPAHRVSPWSGYDVPRFVSFKADMANCRIGPSRAHPVRFEFRRRGLPVMVVAETADKWRKVRDVNGDECWAFHSTLTARSHGLAVRPTEVFARRRFDAYVRGHVAEGAMVRLGAVARDDDGRLWVRVVDERIRGWAPAEGFWGAAVAAERERQGIRAAAFAAARN